MSTLTVAMGMPGSGKSTWCTAFASSTGARLFTTDPVRIDSRDVVAFFARLRSDVDMALAARDDVVVDACNVNTQHRRTWLRMGRRHGARCVLAFIATPADEAMRRNAARPANEQVPCERMQSYARQLPRAHSLVRSERWDEVLTVGAADLLKASSLRTSRAW